MPDRPLGAQISHLLKARGTEVIFGIPGVHNQELYRGIEDAGLRHILARHEQGAGFMADGYARATGRPGVCFVISGPGLTNIMTPIGQSYSDGVPVLVISSCLEDTAATRGQLHQMKDQEMAARCVADWSETARTPEAAYALVDRALMEFDARRRRPKHISVPVGLLTGPAAPAGPAPVGDVTPVAGGNSWLPGLIRHLQSARRPLFIFGGGAVAVRGAGHLLRRLGAASFTTYAGRGIVPSGDPLHFGAMLARPGSADMIARADLIIAVGTELAEVDLWRPQLGHDCGRTPFVRVDIDPETLTDRHGATTPILADAAAFISEIDRALPQTMEAAQTDWTAAEVASARVRWRADVAAEYPGVVEVADALRACLPDGCMIFSDMTQFAYAAKEIWPMDRPGHWHHPSGFGTLGYALPAAIGGAIGRPGKPVLAIAGDYGFQYTVQELATAVELGLGLPIVLWDNGKLGAIEDSMIAAQIAPNAVIQRNPDFLGLAAAYGALGAAPGNLTELRAAVRAAFAAPVPTLIRVTPGIGAA